MRIIIIILTLFLACNITIQAQADTKPKTETDLNKSMEDAFSEIQKLMESGELEKMFGEGMGEMKGFKMDGDQMPDFNQLFDSLGMSKLFGGDLSKMFEGSTIPGMENIDMEKMLEQSLQMLEGMDMNEMNKLFEQFNMQDMGNLFEGIDMKEIEKLFEGMDMEQFKQVLPQDKVAPTEENKKLKKI